MISIQNLIADVTSGSSEILLQTAEVLRQSLIAGHKSDEIMAEFNLLCHTHSSMAALLNLKKHLESKGISENTLDSWFDAYREHEASACRMFAAHLQGYNRVLVHSNSGLLLKSFQQMHRHIEVICTESRPSFEGVLLAEQISRAGHKVTLTTDMGAFSLIRHVDALAFGCDALTKKGIVNKIGTSALAFAARTIGKKTDFIATSEKFAENWEDILLLRQGSGDQIYAGKEGISINNFYFDLTPPDSISGLYLENGLTKETFL